MSQEYTDDVSPSSEKGTTAISCIISGVNVPSDVTEDEVDVSRPLNRLTWLRDVDDVPIEAVVVDLRKYQRFPRLILAKPFETPKETSI